ncbi:MAG: winged helix DNA-binding domain-containing protein, partial [Actinomycetota bacterium]|nr:winged helix DNA-binding domain-containing protein [Actinomycetota bacterium]
MPERVLTRQELNRALLARQLLLERADLPPTQALQQVGGLQAQYAPSAYIGLWSRLEGFEREQLTEALERRQSVQGTLMRVTIHMVSAGDYPLLAAGVRRGRREWWLRTHRRRLGDVDMEDVASRVRSFLGNGPRHRQELVELLRPFDPSGGSMLLGGAGLWVDLLRVPPSGTWEKRRADLYALAETWLGTSEATTEDGLSHLVLRYLGGFGPAPLSDIADWAGLPVTMVRPALDGLKMRRFRDEEGAELLDLPGAPLSPADTPAPVRFLPTWDATLLVHARRTAILPEEYRSLVFNPKT